MEFTTYDQVNLIIVLIVSCEFHNMDHDITYYS